MSKKLFSSAEEIAKELEVSKTSAYKIVQRLNAELKEKGYVTIRGKISRAYFEERFYGMKE